MIALAMIEFGALTIEKITYHDSAHDISSTYPCYSAVQF